MGVDASPTDGNVVVLRSRDGVTDWELDRLARSRLGYFTKRAVSSLSALSKLSLDMPHMAVGKTVGMLVAQALVELESVEEQLGRGDVVAALRHALKPLSMLEWQRAIPAWHL